MKKLKAEGFEVGAEVVVTLNPSDISKPKIYSMNEWTAIEKRLVNADGIDLATRVYQRLVIGYAAGCIVDRNGYVELPEEIQQLISLYSR